jgi:hypothetical protein
VPILLGVVQFVRLFVIVPLAPLSPRRGTGRGSAAIILPPLDFDQREAVVRRRRADRFFQAIDQMFCHIALHSVMAGRASRPRFEKRRT